MANEKILIADDDKNICELLRLYLAKEGYETVIANDGEAAVAAFEKEKPNMVLLDVMMPKMDGWEVCRRIRAADNTHPLSCSRLKARPSTRCSAWSWVRTTM